MGTTYEYTYEYEVQDPSKTTRNTGGNTHRSVTHSHVSRSDAVDPMANMQHDRIWNKLYDPVGVDKAQHDVEIQKMARRQDRKIIKIEAAHGSDRQTFIVKRDYDLRVRDVIDEASRVFKIPPEQVILYWKGRNICETPEVLLETLGVENNNTMRVARGDDQFFQRQRQGQYQQTASSSSGGAGFYGSGGSTYSGGYSGQQYGSGGAYGQQQSLTSSGMYGQQSGAGGSYGQTGASSGEAYSQSQTTYPSQTYYSSYPAGYDQQHMSSGSHGGHHCNCTCHQDQHHGCKCCCHCHGSTNHYQQFTNRTIATPVPAPVLTPAAETYIITLQIGFGDRVLGLAIGRHHPITIYDLQVELQQHYNIPIFEQNIAYNGMPLSHLPPDTALQTIGILNNAFISLWHRNSSYVNQQQISGQFTPRQQAADSSFSSAASAVSSSYYQGGSQSLYDGDMSSRRMYYSNSGGEQMQIGPSQEVMTLEVFHGTDRHVLALRGANNVRIGELMEELQNITTVPVQTQRLYYRGQALQLVKDRSLREVGLDNNAQLRLVGEPTTPRYTGLSARN